MNETRESVDEVLLKHRKWDLTEAPTPPASKLTPKKDSPKSCKLI